MNDAHTSWRLTIKVFPKLVVWDSKAAAATSYLNPQIKAADHQQ
jgi:hypothetical protein